MEFILLATTTALLVVWAIWDFVEARHERSRLTTGSMHDEAVAEGSLQYGRRELTRTFRARIHQRTRGRRFWALATAYKDAGFLLALAAADLTAALHARAELVELERRMAPRTIPPSALLAIAHDLSQIPVEQRRPVDILIASGGGAEVSAYAGEISRAIKDAGWNVTVMNTLVAGLTDIVVGVPMKGKPGLPEQLIQHDLESNGIPSRLAQSDLASRQQVTIIIGDKPVDSTKNRER
jgi:hypothetical protein